MNRHPVCCEPPNAENHQEILPFIDKCYQKVSESVNNSFQAVNTKMVNGIAYRKQPTFRIRVRTGHFGKEDVVWIKK
jgi:hypothetical protein